MASASQAERVILLPVDDTEVTSKLVDWVIANCKNAGDVVHALHITPMPLSELSTRVPLVAFPMTMEPEEGEPDLNPVRVFLKKRVCDRLAAAGIACKVEVLQYLADNSSIGEAICARAEELQADAVVLAKEHHGALEKFFLGSVTMYCAEHCTRTVVLIN